MNSRIHQESESDRKLIAALHAAHEKVASLTIQRGEAMHDATTSIARLAEIRKSLATARRELAALVNEAQVAA